MVGYHCKRRRPSGTRIRRMTRRNLAVFFHHTRQLEYSSKQTLRKLDERRIHAATNSINKSKNRYPLVYPCESRSKLLPLFIDRCLFHVDDEDFCRVKLNRDNNEKYRSASDYINASIVCSVLPVGIEGERSRSLSSLIRSKRLKHPNDSSMLRKVSAAIATEMSHCSGSRF